MVLGISGGLDSKVLRRHEKSAFKRKHLPIVIKRELYEN
jgi:NH3-dependent NAD+ synthetase